MALSERQRRFCEFVVAGCSDVAAYRKAGYKAKEPHKRACEIRANPGVEAHIAELRKPREDAALLTLHQAQVFLGRIIRTPISAVTENDPIAQTLYVTKRGNMVMMPDKLRAIELDAKLAGWLPRKRSRVVEPDALSELMRSIVERKTGA